MNERFFPLRKAAVFRFYVKARRSVMMSFALYCRLRWPRVRQGVRSVALLVVRERADLDALADLLPTARCSARSSRNHVAAIRRRLIAKNSPPVTGLFSAVQTADSRASAWARCGLAGCHPTKTA